MESQVIDGEERQVGNILATVLQYLVGDGNKWTVALRLRASCHVTMEIDFVLQILQLARPLHHCPPQDDPNPVFSWNLDMAAINVILQIHRGLLLYCKATISI